MGVATCHGGRFRHIEALVSEALLTARYNGVEAAVVESLSDLFPRPDWDAHARYLISRTLLHGTRRAEEMEEVARTVGEAGVTPYMSEATVSRQVLAPQSATALENEELTAMLDAIHAMAAAAPIERNTG
ncbi:MAG: DUF1932 domain-containing protein [Halioglobus sp.]|nr:DUF1932 domain-containing protein [Halioglobus sp.]